jgi:hypothetical protein
VNDARLPMWAAMLGASTRALMGADQAARWGGPLTIRRDATAP